MSADAIEAARWRKRCAVRAVEDALVELRVADAKLAEIEATRPSQFPPGRRTTAAAGRAGPAAALCNEEARPPALTRNALGGGLAEGPAVGSAAGPEAIDAGGCAPPVLAARRGFVRDPWCQRAIWDDAALNWLLSRNIEALAHELLPAGRRRGGYWRVGSVAGEPGRSLGIKLPRGAPCWWRDFARYKGEFGWGGDPLQLIADVLFSGCRRAARRFAMRWVS